MKASDTKTFTKVEHHIRTMTDAYLKLGVCVIEDSWHKTYYITGDREVALSEYRKNYLSITSDTFVRAYMRAVAKELKRAFVVATVKTVRVEMVIPRKKFTEPLFAGFLLAPEAKSLSRNAMHEVPVYFRGSVTNVNVTFNGPQGMKMFDMFIERCKTDEDFRKALRTHNSA